MSRASWSTSRGTFLGDRRPANAAVHFQMLIRTLAMPLQAWQQHDCRESSISPSSSTDESELREKWDGSAKRTNSIRDYFFINVINGGLRTENSGQNNASNVCSAMSWQHASPKGKRYPFQKMSPWKSKYWPPVWISDEGKHKHVVNFYTVCWCSPSSL